MAVYLRRGARNEEDESVFVSMTDIMISLLFVVIILMAFFAMQIRATEPMIARSIYDSAVSERDIKIAQRDTIIQELRQELADLRQREQELIKENRELRARIVELEKAQQRALDRFLAGISDRQRKIMERIAERIRQTAQIQVQVDHRQGVIRFNNRDLFRSGQWRVSRTSREIMHVIAEAIVDTLPCYTTGPHSNFMTACNPEFAIIDAIQVEGHTDDQRTAESLRKEYIDDNLELSVRRATTTYRTMVAHKPHLKELMNAEEPAQPVLSVSGYGEARPIADNATTEGRELNRRIDLRFIMMTPQSLNEIDRFKRRLLRSTSNRRQER